MRLTIRDMLWLTGAAAVAIVLIAYGQSSGPSQAGNLASTAGATIFLLTLSRIWTIRTGHRR